MARLLPAGKREFGEISAADVPDNTVKRQRQQGLCLPEENVLPLLQPQNSKGLSPGPRQSVPVLRGPSSFVGHQQVSMSS